MFANNNIVDAVVVIEPNWEHSQWRTERLLRDLGISHVKKYTYDSHHGSSSYFLAHQQAMKDALDENLKNVLVLKSEGLELGASPSFSETCQLTQFVKDQETWEVVVLGIGADILPRSSWKLFGRDAMTAIKRATIKHGSGSYIASQAFMKRMIAMPPDALGNNQVDHLIQHAQTYCIFPCWFRHPQVHLSRGDDIFSFVADGANDMMNGCANVAGVIVKAVDNTDKKSLRSLISGLSIWLLLMIAFLIATSQSRKRKVIHRRPDWAIRHSAVGGVFL